MLIRACLGFCFFATVNFALFSVEAKRNKQVEYEKFSFTNQELNEYKREVKQLFYFAHDSYMQHAYPSDELRPISCVAKTRNFEDLDDVITNDVLGNYSATLIDSLTTIAVLNDRAAFKAAIDLVERTFPRKFDIDSTVQVFETTIRILGSLISSHLYATDPTKKVYLGDEYSGVLLELAKDLGDRLLPAYLTKLGLPLPRINLRHKLDTVKEEHNLENNVAAMASPMFEFTMLSYLTHDEKYAAVAGYAMNKTWSLRSHIDLLPMSFNPHTGQCYSPLSGIGASIDSFYEYALKGALLFDDKSLYNIWRTSYKALVKYCKADWFFVNTQYFTGELAVSWIDSLSAFFPGLQVLAGDIDDAIVKNLLHLKLWNTYGGIPERWLFQGNLSMLSEALGKTYQGLEGESLPGELHRALVPLEWYPLRPEFIESIYYLYRATKDPFYLNIGVEVLENFKTTFKHKCGFAGLQDVISGTPQDRMETFVLSETLKYLYLLFDDGNELHHTRDNVIFSTEAHPMWLRSETIQDYANKKFFNDTIYLRHLRKCYRDEELALTNRKSKANNVKARLTGFAKSLFIDDHKVDSTRGAPENEQKVKDEAVCTAKFRHKNPLSWSYSPILSDFTRLFEIDYRYSSTLIRPRHLTSSVAMEIKEAFYRRWADPFKSICSLSTTTESFQIVIEAPEKEDVVVLPNGDIICHSLSGSIKIVLEILAPGRIDIHGDRVTTMFFENINREDVLNPHHRERFFSPSFLYRVSAVNGVVLPRNGIVTLDRNPIFENPEELRNLKRFFGCNKRDQLMLDRIPVINFYLL